jgi:hypothetical protein
LAGFGFATFAGSDAPGKAVELLQRMLLEFRGDGDDADSASEAEFE